MKIDNFIENTILKDDFHRDKFRDYFDKYCILLYDKGCEYILENVTILFDDLFRYSVTNDVIYLYNKIKKEQDHDYNYTAYMTYNKLYCINDFYKYLDEQLC